MKVKRKPLSTFESKSAKDSINFAFELSKNFKKGDLILLVGDIGSGKTTFLNGVLKYLGSNKTVTSSSFVLVSIYQAKKANLIHCDFYRINGRYFFDEIVEYLNEGIVAVEWPYDIKKYLCFKPFLIKISIEGINARKIEVFKYE